MIFVDTTFWVGYADSNDDFHESARTAIEAVRKGTAPPAMTTSFVLDEAVTILGRRRGFGAARASRVANGILASPRVFTIHVDEALFKHSLSLYPAFDGVLGLTEASTVVAMQSFGVKDTLSHDQDFDKVEGIRRREEVLVT